VQRWAAWLDAAALDRADVPALATDAAPASAMPAAPSPDTMVARRLRQWLADPGSSAPIEAPAENRSDSVPSAVRPPGALGSTPLGGTATRSPDVASPIAASRPSAAAADSLRAERWLALDAGLVLLHPFVPRLFEACGLIEARAREIDAARRPQAAALLHWLGTGREGALEHELTLAKLLVGVEPEAALLPAPTLPADWCDEGQALLAAAIGHWGALGATGIEGLRVSFLRRQGLLSRGDATWHLRVAPEAFDVLLGRLPWALSIVRLPWMPWPLAVEWHAP
jgi:hypothetical protein